MNELIQMEEKQKKKHSIDIQYIFLLIINEKEKLGMMGGLL